MFAMVSFLATSVFLAVVLCVEADRCFERFGTDKVQCTEAEARCEWVEKDGEGKCVMPRGPKHGKDFKDGCFERIGTDKAKCMEAQGECEWLEKDGEGKCVMPKGPKHGHGKGPKHGKDFEDGCFERFGTDKAKCMEAQGECEWLEKDGEGKCVMPKGPKHGHGKGPKHGKDFKDGCFERIGTDKAKCMEAQDKCQWLETDGEGKCVMQRPKHGHEFKDGPGVELEVTKASLAGNSQKISGVLAISLSSSLGSDGVITMLGQHHSLLENAIASSHGYKEVKILGVDSARRLRDASAMNTQVRVRFEAQVSSRSPVSDEASDLEGELERALQQSFTKAGLDLHVQSATLSISSAERSKPDDSSNLALGSMAYLAALIGLLLIFACAAMVAVKIWRRRRSAGAAKAPGNSLGENNLVVMAVGVSADIKSKDLEEMDDLASVSTATPSSHGDTGGSEP